MSKPNTTLDQLAWAERLRAARSWLIGTVLVGGLLALIAASALPGASREVEGVVVGVHGVDSEDGHRLFLQVELESERIVRARAFRATPVRRGDRVRLSETDSRFGSARRYQFLAYVSDP